MQRRQSYFDKSTGIGKCGLLAHLLHHFGLCVGHGCGIRWAEKDVMCRNCRMILKALPEMLHRFPCTVL